MEYGTLKSEVRSQYEGVSQDYYHYEITTRWWKKKEGGGFEWKHTLTRIDRDGTIQRLEDIPDHDVIKSAMTDYLRDQPSSVSQVGVAMQGQISTQHAYLVRLVMG